MPLLGNLRVTSSRSDLGVTFQQYYVCSKKITPVPSGDDEYFISKQQIEEACQSTPNDLVLETLVSDPNKGLE